MVSSTSYVYRPSSVAQSMPLSVARMRRIVSLRFRHGAADRSTNSAFRSATWRPVKEFLRTLGGLLQAGLDSDPYFFACATEAWASVPARLTTFSQLGLVLRRLSGDWRARHE